MVIGQEKAVIERHGRRLFPFAVELAARARHGVTQAALMAHGDEVVLVIEGLRSQCDLVGQVTALTPSPSR